MAKIQLFGDASIEILSDDITLWQGAMLVRRLGKVEAVNIIQEYETEKLKWEEQMGELEAIRAASRGVRDVW